MLLGKHNKQFLCTIMDSSLAEKIKQVLTGRAARNIYFWGCCLYFACDTNANNELVYHYGITRSVWYLPVMLGSLFLQCTLVYTNNLVLVPKLLAKGRKAAYVGLTVLLATLISILTVVLFKTARPYLNVEELQHPGFTTTIISLVWSLHAIASELQTFLFSDLMWCLVFTMAWYMNDYTRQKQSLRLAEEQRTQAELAFLKNQINPHFLFNTLNNIYGLALRKADSTPELILRLSDMLRYLLYESDLPNISFQKEQSAIEAYVGIEALRLPDEATIAMDVYADKDYQLPSLLWMPMLENAFKHGTRLIHLPVSVNFSFRIEQNVLVIKTVNNFEPAPPKAMPDQGIGLTNMKKRLDLLFPGRYTFQQQEAGTAVSYTLTIYLI